jgi:tetratricopeptide (TPR) repeat protein
MSDLRSNLRLTKIKRRMRKIITLDIIEQKFFSLLKIMIIFLAIFFLIIVTFWIFEREDGITVQPFETAEIGENTNGKSLAILLSYDLQKIKNIYSGQDLPAILKGNIGGSTIPRPLGEFCVPPLSNFKNLPMEYSISQIGTVGVEGTSISIGNLLLSIKEFLGYRANTITCSLLKYNSTLIIVAILEDGKEIMTFEVKENISNSEQIPNLINDLAFQISLALTKQGAQLNEDDLYPQDWHTFKYITQGRDAYNSYIAMKDISYLDKINYLNKGRNMALLAIKSEPGYSGSFELLSGLGFAYLEMGKYNEAEKIFKNITKVKPFESALGLGLTYGEQGYFAGALSAFNNAVQINPQDVDTWNMDLILVDTWNNMGLILYKQGNYSGAIKAFEDAIRLNQQNVAAWKHKGDALARLGKIEKNNSRYDEAIQAYDKAIELNPQYDDAWYNKGVAQGYRGEYNESILAYDEAIRLNSTNAAAWYGKGSSLSNMNKNDEALAACNKSVELDPNNKNAWTCKEIVLERLNRHNESLKAGQIARSLKNETQSKGSNMLKQDLRQFKEASEGSGKFVNNTQL